jgi:hypothetical protein
MLSVIGGADKLPIRGGKGDEDKALRINQPIRRYIRNDIRVSCVTQIMAGLHDALFSSWHACQTHCLME